MTDKENKTEFHSEMALSKIDDETRMVFGFFSVMEKAGEAVVDVQDDIIEPREMEKAAYDFVLHARLGGEQHTRMGIGELVESMVFTTEKQEAIVAALKAQGIDASLDLGVQAWWGGFHITDDAVWNAVKAGEYAAFSIGGVATREDLGD